MKWFKRLSPKKYVNQNNSTNNNNSTIINNITTTTTTSAATAATTTATATIVNCQIYNNNHHHHQKRKECNNGGGCSSTSSVVCCGGGGGSDGGCGCESVGDVINKQKNQSDHRTLKAHAKRLENIISCNDNDDDDNNLTNSLIERHLIDPDEFFSDPIDVSLYKAEIRLLNDWIIVDNDNLTSQINGDHDHHEQQENNSDIEQTYEKIERPPSVISLNSYENDEYGLFFSCNLSIYDIPEANYCRTLEDDIQQGARIDKYLLRSLLFQNIPEIEYHRTRKGDDHKILKTNKKIDDHFIGGTDCNGGAVGGGNKIDTGKLFHKKSTDCNEKLPNCSRTLKDKNFTPVFNSSFNKEPNKKSPDFSIQKYFGLNDYGDIIIHLEHIKEEEGFGFLSKNKYRQVPAGVEINEKFELKINWKYLFKRFINFFWIKNNRNDGHPRNKAPNNLPGQSISAYTLSLASDRTSTFSRNIENFISCTKESREIAPQIVMRNMRQFMSGMKNYLVKHGEGDFQREVQRAREHLKSDEFLNLDTILESVMHRLVVLPLREHLYSLFVDYYTRSGDIQLLVENVKYASGRTAIDFGIRSSVTPPSTSSLRQISSILVRLQEAELPLEKLELLLTAVSSVYEATGCPRGQQLSADDFLPLLVLVVAKCGFIGAEIEAEFMWGLLQPSLLSGEAGYYLTALCSAVHVLKSFMSSENEGTGSLDLRSSFLPASSSVLRVIIPDECNGSLQTRTLPVRPHTTTREVCRTIAHKARITNPQDYGLFKLVDGEETLLMDNECPQDVRISARGKHCMLAYKRIDAKIAWPTLIPSSF